jgi:hypothetical protein
MADRRYLVGERVLVSRSQDGQNHEEATVTDFYELLISGQPPIPTAVVDFDDGQRLYITARAPDFLPMDEDEDDDEDWDDDEEGGDMDASEPDESSASEAAEPDAADAVE